MAVTEAHLRQVAQASITSLNYPGDTLTPQAETPGQRFSITVGVDGRVELHPGWDMEPEDFALAGECWAGVKEALERSI